jgi:hypothetical protein
MDVSAEAVKTARSYGELPNLEFRVGDARTASAVN